MGRRKKDAPEVAVTYDEQGVLVPTTPYAPAMTPEGRENQLISLATNLAEQQLIAGTASAQVITHYLKLGTTMARLEMEKLKRENELLVAKTENLQSAARIEELYKEAIVAFRDYAGDDHA